MPTIATKGIPKFRVDNAYNKAGDSALLYVNRKDRNDFLLEKKEHLLPEGDISVAYTIMWPIFLIALASLTIFAAYNAHDSIMAIVDPTGESNFPGFAFYLIAGSLPVIAFLFGLSLHKGFEKGIVVDEYTGTKSLTSQFIYAPLGFIGSILYLYILYFLISVATNNSNPTLVNLVVLLGIVEVIVGALILEEVLLYLNVFSILLRQKYNNMRMNSAARQTHTQYRKYLTLLNYYNEQNNSDTRPEANEAIVDAIAYYSGTRTAGRTSTTTTTNPPQLGTNNELGSSPITPEDGTQTRGSNNTAEKNVTELLDEDDHEEDQNLTV